MDSWWLPVNDYQMTDSQPAVPTRTLPGGDELPLVGYGTYGLTPAETTPAVETALDAGYRYLDCAEGYGNEAAVGEALAAHDREELFLTSKVVPSNLHYEDVLRSCEATLERLGTRYLDLYLIHWPNPAVSLRETLSAMAKLHRDGRVRNVGVSNFSTYQLRFAQKVAPVPVAVNQVEFHPWFTQPELSEHCAAADVALIAAAPLARARVLADETIQSLADEYHMTPAQIVLRWQVQSGIATIPRSTTAAHIRSNIDILDWSLAPTDVDRIESIDRRERVYMIDPDHETYGISE